MILDIPLYVRFHIEDIKSEDNRTYVVNQVTYQNDLNIDEPVSFSKREATFEYVSDRAIDCAVDEGLLNPVTRHWLNVQFTTTISDGRSFVETRYIPIKCFTDLQPVSTSTTPEGTLTPITMKETTFFTTPGFQATTELLTTITTDAHTSSDIATDAFSSSDTVIQTTTEVVTTEGKISGALIDEVLTTEGIINEGTTIEETTENSPSTVTNTPDLTCSSPDKKCPSLIIAISDKYAISQKTAFLTGVFGLDSAFAESSYSDFTLLLFDVVGFNYSTAKQTTTDYTEFTNYVIDMAYNDGSTKSESSNVLDVLLDLLTDSDVNPNSAISIMVGNLLIPEDDDKKLKIIQYATSKQIKVNPIMDLTYYEPRVLENLESSLEFLFYEQLAAVADGHFMLIKPTDRFSNNGTYVLANVCHSLFYYPY